MPLRSPTNSVEGHSQQHFFSLRSPPWAKKILASKTFDGRRMKRWVNPEIVLGIALGIVLCLFVAVVLSDQIEHCGQINPQTAQTPSDKPQVPSATQTHKGGSDEKTEYDKSHPIACGVLGFVPSAIHYMDRNEGFFLGAFTLALFLATSFLWRSTEKLW